MRSEDNDDGHKPTDWTDEPREYGQLNCKGFMVTITLNGKTSCITEVVR